MNDFIVRLTPSGHVDEVILASASFSMLRTGISRYRLNASSSALKNIALELWTSKKGQIKAFIENEEDWMSVSWKTDGILERLHVDKCSIHLEQMDRGFYWIGLSREDDTVNIQLTTKGYIKSKIVESNISASLKAQRFREWVRKQPQTGISLPDEACDRGSIYE